MIEWNVYLDGVFVGTVFADSEAVARLAALSDFDVDSLTDVSVSRR